MSSRKTKNEVILISDDDSEQETQEINNYLKRKESTSQNSEKEDEEEQSHASNKKRKITSLDVVENNSARFPISEEESTKNQSKLKESTNYENPFFQNIPLYQMRIIVSYLDFLSFLKLSQTCSFIRTEYFSKTEFWNALSEQVIVHSLSPSLVFDKSSTESIAVIPNKFSLVTLRTFFSIYFESFSFMNQTSRLVLDFDSYMYNTLDKKDVCLIPSYFKNLRDLQLLNIKFSEAKDQLPIIKSIISNQMTGLKRLKITFSENNTSNRSFLESQNNLLHETETASEFSKFLPCLQGLEAFHIGNVIGCTISSEKWTPQLSWTELLQIDQVAQETLLSFGVENVLSSDFHKLLFGDQKILPRLEELFVRSVMDNCGALTDMFQRASLKKLIISDFITNNANVFQYIVKQLPNITYMDVKLVPSDGETKPDGMVYLKSDSLRFLKFSDFNKFFDSNLIQLDLPNIEQLSLENFGEISILQEKLLHLTKLEIRNSMMLTGQLHSILSKCATSVSYLIIDSCPNVRNIHILKDVFGEKFAYLRHCQISNCKLLEKVSISCIGVGVEDVKYLYMQNLSLSNLQSLREFRCEYGTDQITSRIVSLNLSYCDGLKVLHPEASLKTIQNLSVTGGCESNLWNSIIQNCLKSAQELKTLTLHFKNSILVHAFAFRLSNLIRDIPRVEEFTLSSKFSTNTFMFNFSSLSLKKLKIISENENPVDFYITTPLLENLELTRITNIRIKSNHLSSLNVTHSNMRQLSISSDNNQLSNMENIYLNTVTGEALLKTLSQCPNVKRLTLIQVDSNAIVKTLLPRFEFLENLYISGPVRRFQLIPSLRMVNIMSQTLQSVIVPKIETSKYYQLAKLNLSFCSNLSKIDIESKDTTLPYLRMVDVRTTKVQDASLKKIISRAPRLSCIRAGSSAVSEKFEKEIKQGNRKANFTKK
ncbi:hypothetical protein C9374_009968 [Naegleria lovaniensis]|uniref:F-box domain-containing protein n=1 Tax=Naegleria lovaniensis TaxID=51637 RepID=A0AA88GD55_NAELO|nr:uncharacterized protein C9374_009968 [Naegleria lovaniensis]KAG2375345.1 hypothetical protein C9374_009968 [Naegleria lovaniensis]